LLPQLDFFDSELQNIKFKKIKNPLQKPEKPLKYKTYKNFFKTLGFHEPWPQRREGE